MVADSIKSINKNCSKEFLFINHMFAIVCFALTCGYPFSYGSCRGYSFTFPCHKGNTGELGYDGPLYDGFLHMTDDMLGPSPMHIKYLSYVYDGFCI